MIQALSDLQLVAGVTDVVTSMPIDAKGLQLTICGGVTDVRPLPGVGAKRLANFLYCRCHFVVGACGLRRIRYRP